MKKHILLSCLFNIVLIVLGHQVYAQKYFVSKKYTQDYPKVTLYIHFDSSFVHQHNQFEIKCGDSVLNYKLLSDYKPSKDSSEETLNKKVSTLPSAKKIFLLIERSYFTFTNGQNLEIRKALKDYINSLDASVEVGVAFFNYSDPSGKTIKKLTDGFTANRETLNDVIDEATGKYYTKASYADIHKALDESLDWIKSFNAGHVNFLLLSSGRIHKDAPIGEDAIVKKANDQNIRINTIGIHSGDQVYFQNLENISNKTNGRYTNIKKNESYQVAINEMLLLPSSGIDNNNVENFLSDSDSLKSNKVFAQFTLPTSNKSEQLLTIKFYNQDAITTSIIKPQPKGLNNNLSIALMILATLLVLGLIGYYFTQKNKTKNENLEFENPEFQQSAESEAGIGETQIGNDLSSTQIGGLKSPKVDANSIEQLYPNVDDISKVDNLESLTSTTILSNQSNSESPPRELYVYNGKEISHLTLQQNEILIGRNSENNLMISNPSVSNFHCKLLCENDKWFVLDLNSTNGTKINGNERIHNKTAIFASDKLVLGDVIIELK